MTGNISHLFQERDPWTNAQCNDWARSQVIKKPYGDLLERVKDVAINLRNKNVPVSLESYGHTLSYNQVYDLTKTVVGDLKNGKDTIVITGGVHGYEPSGEESCIRFLETFDKNLLGQFNFVVYSCITPSAYVTNHRWNNFANDQNRAFDPSLLTSGNFEITSRNQEAILFMQDIENIKDMGVNIVAGVDVHETPEMDIQLRIARAERYGSKLSKDYQELPDASYFYIGEEAQAIKSGIIIPDFARAVSSAMEEFIPMAQDEYIIGSKNHGNGIAISGTKSTLRHFMAQHAGISITTEICPESISGSNEQRKDAAVLGQLAAVYGIIKHLQLST